MVKRISFERKKLILELNHFIINLKKELNIRETYKFVHILNDIIKIRRNKKLFKNPTYEKIFLEIDNKFHDFVNKYKCSRIQTDRRNVNFKTIEDHFLLVLDIIDFVFGVSLTELKEKFHMTDSTLNQIAKIVIKNKFDNRFKHTFSDNYIIKVAENIERIEFKNFTHPQFQRLLKYYRNISGTNSPYNVVRITREFALWIKNIDESKLINILDGYSSKLNKDEILKKCEIINRNSEIVKFVVHRIIQTEESARQIAKRAGISKSTVSKYIKLLKRGRDIITKEKIMKIAKDILDDKITEISFQNFNNPKLQFLLKEYSLSIKSDKYLIRPIHSFKIISDFKTWTKNQDIDYDETIKKVVSINRNNEIINCILYRMLIDKWVPVDIARKYNIPRKKIQKIANFLGFYNTLSNIDLRDKIINDLELGISIEVISDNIGIKIDLINDISEIVNEIRDFENGRSLTKIAKAYGVSRRPITDIAKKILNPTLYDIRFNDTYFAKYRNIGILSHKCINFLMTRKLGSLYYSEIVIFLNYNYRIDGLLIVNKDFTQKIRDNLVKLKLDLFKYKIILFDFTSNLNEENILDKARKYYTPYTLLFIIGISDMPLKVIDFPKNAKISEKERNLYSKRVIIIRHDLFAEIMDFNEEERKIFHNIVINNIVVTKNNITSNLRELKDLKIKLSNYCKVNHKKELKKFLENHAQLKVEFNKIHKYEKENQKKIDDF